MKDEEFMNQKAEDMMIEELAEAIKIKVKQSKKLAEGSTIHPVGDLE